ncbi:MAG TPA: DUF4232 domain-containing protein [Candidatus Limnocylindrales bacterium]|nr:DUF4232 domain-containing protein [Candidatus Limnocylindrales bacterium]
MTNLPGDPIDDGEALFARRVRDYTEPAVVPVDHARIAAAVAVTGGPRRSGAGRWGWLVAGAALAAGIAAVAILFNPSQRPDVGGVATPTAPAAAIDGCTAGSLQATVGSWEGAAGHRIGTLTVTNSGGVACVLSGAPVPSLIDRNGHELIVGRIADMQAVQLAAGASIQTLVQTGNYCGPTAQEPAAVALDFGALGRVVATPLAGDDSSGVPPCLGEAGPKDDITLQPWGSAAQG